MEYVNLGKSGLKVSRLCLGCMSFGEPTRGAHPWSLDEKQSRPFFARALELGINFFDTSNSYSDGTSEEFLGRALSDLAKRDEVVIATKVYYPRRSDPNGRGLSRKAILAEVDASLCRLETDYIDLYQIHRWDYNTPVEETLEALHDVVKAGKARYIGASSMFAWQLCKALYLADRHRWTRFISMQDHYNLLYREEEREMLPLCRAEGIGVMPWSPLARGRLTRPWSDRDAGPRATTDDFGKTLYVGAEAAERAIVDAVCRIAKERNVAPAQVAWRGCYINRPSLRRSSAPRATVISKTPSPHWSCNSLTTSERRSRNRTWPEPWRDFNESSLASILSFPFSRRRRAVPHRFCLENT